MKMDPAPTLVIADYPVGYASGFGETLHNLFSGFPRGKLWSAHPGHIAPAEDKQKAQSVRLPSPVRPRWLNRRFAPAYYPLLKAQQFQAARQAVRLLQRGRRKKFDPEPPGSASQSVDTLVRTCAAQAISKTKPRILRDGRLAGASRVSSVAILALAPAPAPRSDRSR